MAGLAISGCGDHGGREIDADNGRAAPRGRSGHVTGSGRDIDYLCARFDTRGVEQWLDTLSGELAEGLMIGAGNTLPTPVLKLAKSVGINHGS